MHHKKNKNKSVIALRFVSPRSSLLLLDFNTSLTVFKIIEFVLKKEANVINEIKRKSQTVSRVTNVSTN